MRREEVMNVTEKLDGRLERRLSALVRRLRAYALVEALGLIVGTWALAFTVQVAFDYTFRPSRSIRAALLAGVVFALAWLAWRRVLPVLRTRLGLPEAARLIERFHPESASTVVSAVRFASGRIGHPASNSPELADSVIRQAARLTSSLNFQAILSSRRVIVSGVIMAAVAGCLTIWFQVCSSSLSIAFRRATLLSDVSWPRRTYLMLDLPDRTLVAARGDDVEIGAEVQGVMPRAVELVYRTTSGQKGRQTMTTVGGRRLRYTFLSIREELEFYLEGGDDRTEPHRIVLRDRPTIIGHRIDIEPPAYTGLETVSVSDDRRRVDVLPGGTVTLHVSTNKPVERARLMAGDTPIADAQPAEEDAAPSEDSESPASRHWRARFEPTQTMTVHFDLIDADGLRDKRPLRFVFRVMVDQAPTVTLTTPGAGDLITPQARLPIELTCADDHGLAVVTLTVTSSDANRAARDLPLPDFEPGGKKLETAWTWPVESFGVSAGQTLTLTARAADFDDVSGPNVATSPPITLRVVTPEELSAELARREQEYRAEFQRLIDRQEDLRRNLLGAWDALKNETDARERAAALAPQERRQRSLAGAVGVIGQQFRRLHDALRINQLDLLGHARRMLQGIIEPLDELARKDLIDAADAIRRWTRLGGEAIGAQVDPLQAAALEKMRAALVNMIESEGYHESIAMLREIIRLQKELQRETKEKIEESGADIFDD